MTDNVLIQVGTTPKTRYAKTKSLGWGLRLVQVYYAIVLCVGLGLAAFASPKDLSDLYDFTMLRAIVQMVTSMQALWLLEGRKRFAKPFCIISTLVCIMLASLDLIVGPETSPFLDFFGKGFTVAFLVVEYILACVVVGFLALSKEVDVRLCEELDMASEGPNNSWDALPLPLRMRTWAFWRDITIYFIVFSFLGHWAEILFCRMIVAGIFMGGYDPTNIMLWNQWLFPFSAEGTALAMVVLLLHPLKLWIERRTNHNLRLTLGLSFLANAIVCTSIDFITGITCNQNYELWDYRDMPFNFMGQVCLQNSMVYSIAATIVVWLVYPAMDRLLRSIPKCLADAIFFGLVGLYAFEAALHFISIV